jgi:hypothetical protein
VRDVQRPVEGGRALVDLRDEPAAFGLSRVERRSRGQPAVGDRVADQIEQPAELAADRDQADRRTDGAEPASRRDTQVELRARMKPAA